MRHPDRLTAYVLMSTAALVLSCGAGGQRANQLQHDRDASAPATSNPDSRGKGLGAPCSLTVTGGPSQFAYNAQALECDSRLCIGMASLAAPDIDPLCSSHCQKDDDCVGVLRDPNQPTDKGCVNGFGCGVIAMRGPLCCRGVCMCKDSVGGLKLSIPSTCLVDAGNNCPE